MIINLEYEGNHYTADLSKPVDISIPVGGKNHVLAWYLDAPKIEPVVSGDFVGDVASGSPVNFRNIFFNPHAHGTHTECVGHISKEVSSINKTLAGHHFTAELISVVPRPVGDDKVVLKEDVVAKLRNKPEAVIIRTLPNDETKKKKNYSHTNPPYLEASLTGWLADNDVKHLLVDLPSVDREEDGGALKAHKAFWQYPKNIRQEATITEFVYVPNHIEDGLYLLNLQTAPFENDATPSRPVIFKLIF